MRFLVDAQLPPALARWLAEAGHTAEHVADSGMESAEDTPIWTRALATNAVIVTKDEDFANRILLQPAGPAVLWLRLGNCCTRNLLARLKPVLPDIVDRLQQAEKLGEVI